ncbi:MAG TPA: hypothetical protein VG370_14010 [Chloroflexota bacterium]|jgi:hypothetical protein|nr:hypothetical protein [Chloroflexota bacterium]
MTGDGGMGDMMGGAMGWLMGVWMAAGGLITLLVIVVLALAAVWLFQQVRGGPGHPQA